MLRHFFLFTILLLLHIMLPAQTQAFQVDVKPRWLYYIGVGPTVLPSDFSPVLSFNVVSPSGIGVGFRWQTWDGEAYALPSDYFSVPGNCPFGDCAPLEFAYFATLYAMVEFPTNKPWLRWGMEAGPDFHSYEEARFTPAPFPSYYNYLYDYQYHTTVGVFGRVKMEFQPTRWLGAEVAVSSHLNGYYSVICLELVGKLGRVK